MSLLKIITTQTVVAGKFKDQFIVVDADGNLIGKKAHGTKADAEAELGTLKYFAEGLSFAKATSPADATAQGLNTKANVVAAYLLYKDQQAAGEMSEVVPASEGTADPEQFN